MARVRATRAKTCRSLSFGLVAALIFGHEGLSAAETESVFELSGYVAAEGRYFWDNPLSPQQRHGDLSLVLRPEFYWEWDGGASSLSFEPFLRLDSVDDERTHGDIRELLYRYSSDDWELRAGVGQVFWGVTEARHLVDVINQTDAVENPELEDKLGQPMVDLTLFTEQGGSLDLYLLPYFRERTFPGIEGRLRTTPRVDNGAEPVYEAGNREQHLDVALRWANYIGDLELALSYFHGTSREPLFLPRVQPDGELVLVPRYDLIDQVGLELQYVHGAMLWKFEGYNRWGQGDRFAAFDAGFEYTIGGVAGSSADLGLLAEILYEERDSGYWDNALVFNPLKDAWMLGTRLSLNDVNGSRALAALLLDHDSSAKVFRLEASRRLSDRVRLSLQGFVFMDIPENDPAYTMRRDSFVRGEIAWYF